MPTCVCRDIKSVGEAMKRISIIIITVLLLFFIITFYVHGEELTDKAGQFFSFMAKEIVRFKTPPPFELEEGLLETLPGKEGKHLPCFAGLSERGQGHHEPDGRLGVLAPVFPYPGLVALDISGFEVGLVEGRRQQANEASRVVDQVAPDAFK